jgi:aspartate/methionine/tyrosine aminotransferase
MFINAPTVSQMAALKCWEDERIVELENHAKQFQTSRKLILEQELQ